MGVKARERPTKPQNGDRSACSICNPRDRIPYWMVWIGKYELNEGVKP